MFPNFFERKFLDHLTTGIIVLDQDLKVSYSNSAADMMLEISGQRSKGVAIHDLLMAGNEPLFGVKECIKTKHSFTERERVLITLAGNRITVDYTVTPVTDRSKPLVLMEVSARDRLQRISREEDLLAKQESSRMLIRGLAHEIKNPLGGIRGAAQLLHKQLDDSNRQDYTKIIMEEADRLRKLVDRMLGPNQSFKQDKVNVHEVLERVVNLVEVESAGKIILHRDYDPSIPELIGDKEQLIQALLNISRNAMEALGHKIDGGEPDPENRPTIIFRTRPLRQFTIGQTLHRLVIRIDIIDNGPGIPAALLNSIFYPMVSGRPEGSGLGLSITQSIISQHQGLVECESKPGNTNFIIYIPLEPKL